MLFLHTTTAFFTRLTVQRLLFFMTLFVSQYSVAQQPHLTNEHNQHGQHKHSQHKAHHKTAIGIHGMAVVQMGNTFYASHMPLANSMHAHQVIFSFDLNSDDMQQVNLLNKETTLVTMMPERFDLMKLLSGELTQFSATFFKGHFERGGVPIIKNVMVTVKDMMLSTSLNTTKGTAKNGGFYLLPVSHSKGLLVHNIGQAPSFDQILSVEFEPIHLLHNKPIKLTLGNKTPIVEPVHIQQPFKSLHDDIMINIVNAESLYIETQDFQ